MKSRKKNNMDRTLNVGVALLLFCGLCCATQDATIIVEANNTGICLSADVPTNPVCEGNLSIEGTQDHILYIVPYSTLQGNSSLGQRFHYYFMSPFTLFFSGTFTIIFVLIAVIVLIKLLAAWCGFDWKVL